MSQTTEAERNILAAVTSFQQHVDQLGTRSGEVSIRNIACDGVNNKKFEAQFTLFTIGYPKRPQGDFQSPMLSRLLVEFEVPVKVNTVTYDATVDLCYDITLVMSMPHVTIPGMKIPDFDVPSSHRTKITTKNGNLRQGPIVIDLRIPTAPFNVSVTVSLVGNDINVDLSSGHAVFHL